MSRWQDSNLQHPGSKPDALPGYATPRRSIKLCADSPRHCTMCVPRRLRPCVRRPLRLAGDSRTTSPTGRHRGNVLRAATYACLRPDRGVHRLGRRRVSGRRSPASRPASGRTGSGRPARSWNWSVDPWMLLAVVMLLPSRVPLYAVAAHPSSIHRRFFFEYRHCPPGRARGVDSERARAATHRSDRGRSAPRCQRPLREVVAPPLRGLFGLTVTLTCVRQPGECPAP